MKKAYWVGLVDVKNYDEYQKYEIEIVDGIDFKASKYFDIRSNNWKLDKLVPSVLEANELCKQSKHTKL